MAKLDFLRKQLFKIFLMIIIIIMFFVLILIILYSQKNLTSFFGDVWRITETETGTIYIRSFLIISILFVTLLINLVIVAFLNLKYKRFVTRYQFLLAEVSRLHMVANKSPVMILITDLQGIIRYANPKFSEITGYAPENILGKNMRDLDLGRSATEDYERIWQTIVTGKEWRGETYLKKKDGGYYWENTVMAPVTDQDGGIKNIVILGEDITLLKQAEHELNEAKNIKSTFTSMVSHELRTPLTVIKEIINIVLRGASGPINAEQRDFLDTAKRNIDRLARLVNNVLDFQKLGSGKMPFYMQWNDINEVVMEIYRSMSVLAEDKGLGFDLELHDALPKIILDRDKIIQVLTNLVNNSIKFTETGGVKIITYKEGNALHITVKDTGIGIAEEDIPKLFRSFEQIGDPETRQSGGTGLGLVISKEIILKHRGKIWVDSVVGKGSAFHFILPFEERRT